MSPAPPAVDPHAFGIGASPMSSSFDGRTSYTNTPNTRLTAYSPQDARSGQYGVGRPRMTTVREVGDDPFVNYASRLGGEARASRPLSATASVFTPQARVLSNDEQAWQLLQNNIVAGLGMFSLLSTAKTKCQQSLAAICLKACQCRTRLQGLPENEALVSHQPSFESFERQ